MRNQVHLITYADRLAGSIRGLCDLLDGVLHGFGGVHVLPFFDPIDGVDAGFDPVDHLAVDARLGTWDDVAALAARHDLMADMIVNHASVRSAPFADWLVRGGRSPADGMFLTFDRVFPDGATEAGLARIYRPRPGLPFRPVTLADGSRRVVWTTFEPDQIDLDVTSPAARRYLGDILDRLAGAGVRHVRLDAVGYAVKRAGTSCFLIPETMDFVDDLTAQARHRGLEVLVEVHGHHTEQLAIAPHVDHVYDFALPPLVLHALRTGSPAALDEWLDVRPPNSVTVLDTHDGIGVIDVAEEGGRPGLLPAADVLELVEWIDANSAGVSRRATRPVAWGFPYQVNSTFYDALAGDAERYLLARLVQLFVPGVPQVYYVGLLAGRNDVALFERTGVGRDVNRHHYTAEELAAALERPVVRALLALVRWRGRHPAFGGTFHRAPRRPHGLGLRWRDGAHQASLDVDFQQRSYTLRWTEEERTVMATTVGEVASLAAPP